MEVTFNVGWLELLMPPDDAGLVPLELLGDVDEADEELVLPVI
ncbi:MAG TPA: hypothetical protein VJT08_14835 [Terriglobales bacterium]|nr:hypothetical protein [Terriglobales bacterium]